jgi:hypothetical protein
VGAGSGAGTRTTRFDTERPQASEKAICVKKARFEAK